MLYELNKFVEYSCIFYHFISQEVNVGSNPGFCCCGIFESFVVVL